jgi:hypothetical protein
VRRFWQLDDWHSPCSLGIWGIFAVSLAMLTEREMEAAMIPRSQPLEAQIAWQSLESTSTIRGSRQISFPFRQQHTTVLFVYHFLNIVLLDDNGNDRSIAILIDGQAVFRAALFGLFLDSLRDDEIFPRPNPSSRISSGEWNDIMLKFDSPIVVLPALQLHDW